MVDITGLKDLKPVGAATSFAKEFRDFLLKTNMIALALAVVIGNAVGKVVKSIVDDLMGGVVKVIQGNAQGWDALNFKIWHTNIEVRLGSFAGVMLEFLMVAAIVFFISKIFIKNAPPPPTKTCPACKSGINPDATKCMYCTADQPSAEAPKPAV